MPPRIPAPGTTPATRQLITVGGIQYEEKLVNCGRRTCTNCFPDADRFPIGTEYNGRRRPTHGPYWYMILRVRSGGLIRVYLGKDLDTKAYRLENGDPDWKTIMARRDARRRRRVARAEGSKTHA